MKLSTLNYWLGWLGLKLVIAVWDGEGEWEPTQLWIETTRSWRRRVARGEADQPR